VSYEAKYLGGYEKNPKPQDVHLIATPDKLEVPEIQLTIPYERLSGAQLVPQRIPLSAMIPFIGARRVAQAKTYMLLSYRDEKGSKQYVTFDVDLINEFNAALRERVIAFRARARGEAQKPPETPQQPRQNP
jgi:hypothetical protein